MRGARGSRLIGSEVIREAETRSPDRDIGYPGYLRLASNFYKIFIVII